MRSTIERLCFEQNVSLAPYTTWNIGGPAEYFLEISRIDDLPIVYKWAKNNGKHLTVIGRGSNTLVDDMGIPGIVVSFRRHLNNVLVDHNNGVILAQAGCSLPRLAMEAQKAGIAGFEFLIGIPGTVGAGVAMNAGTGGVKGPSIIDILRSITVFDINSGRFSVMQPSEIGAQYRHTDILAQGLWIVEASFFSGKVDEPQSIANTHNEILCKRENSQPLCRRTSGSVFRQPLGGRSAGWYIDKAGLKGFQIGGAMVSKVHANWIENVCCASSKDIKALITYIQDTVRNEFAIKLQREICYLPDDLLNRE